MHRPKSCSLHQFLFLCVTASVNGPCIGGEVVIELLHSPKTIETNDVLFLQVVVTNESESPVTLRQLIGGPLGTLIFEVRSPKSEGFQGVFAVGQGELGFGSLDLPLVPLGKQFSSEALLRHKRDSFIFSESGVYSIRATVSPAVPEIAPSNTIEITVNVRKRDDDESRLKALECLNSGLGYRGLGTQQNSEALADLAQELDDSQLKETLRWMSLIAEIREMPDGMKRARIAADLEKLRLSRHPVVRDWISLTLAGEYIKLKEFKLAKSELAKIDDRNTSKQQSLKRLVLHEQMFLDLRSLPKP